jgi:hypothetical protein
MSCSRATASLTFKSSAPLPSNSGLADGQLGSTKKWESFDTMIWSEYGLDAKFVHKMRNKINAPFH